MSRTEHTDKEKSDILRYRSGDMTGEERHAFERKMQADPFLAGAEEGLSLVTPGEAAADMEFLGRRLRTRTRRRSFVVYSGVAAALLLLLVTSVIFLRTGSESHQESGLAMDAKQVSKDSIDNIALGSGVPEEDRMGAGEKQTQTPAGTIKPTGTIKEAAEPAVVETEKVARSDKKAVTGTVAETGKREEAEIRPDTAAMRRKADVAAGVPVTDVSVVPDMAAVSRMAMKAEPVAKALSTVIRGIVISAEDSLPIPGAVIAIKGTDKIAVTDAEGRFTLTALADTSQMLVGKFIGMNDTEVRISVDDLQKITMSQSLLTLDEVVVVGYGTSQSSKLSGAVSGVSVSLETPVAEYKAAEPAGGYPAFREYIKQNIIYPEEAAGGTREVVVVDLPVTREGTIGTPVIVRSPGEAFSKAAIKLLQNGPLWKPSSMNGISSDDTVRIRLVFRK